MHLHKLLDNINSINRYKNGRKKDCFCICECPCTCAHIHTLTKGLAHACPTDHLAGRVNRRLYSLDVHSNLLQQNLSMPGSSYRDQ